MQRVATVEEYIALYPEKVQKLLKRVRKVIREAAPEATETISYGIPTFKLKGNLVHFGAFKTHIGFYPGPTGIEAFKNELEEYYGGKGTIKFPLDEAVPYDLITKIVKFRVSENAKKK